MTAHSLTDAQIDELARLLALALADAWRRRQAAAPPEPAKLAKDATA